MDRPFETTAALGRLDLKVQRLSVERPDLERVLLKLTAPELRDS
jgi:hypothetical protein